MSLCYIVILCYDYQVYHVKIYRVISEGVLLKVKVMQVVNENSALLSNYEVFSLLSDIQRGANGQRKPANDQNQLATVTYETLRYLERTPAAHQSPEV